MESEIVETQTKKTPKPFSIESIIGNTTRKSPEIVIENHLSDSRTSEDDETERLNGLNRMRYYFNAPFLQQNGGFPFLLGYPEPWLRMLNPVQREESREEEKRESPVSVGSEMESDGGEDNTQGINKNVFYIYSIKL